MIDAASITTSEFITSTCRGATCELKSKKFAIYQHCLPFNVSRAYDEARDIDTPRFWIARRDLEMWGALQS